MEAKKLRQKIIFSPEDSRTLTLPIHYNHMVQAMIYNSLDDDIADFLHDKGFVYEKRTFKMFAFSRSELRRSRMECISIMHVK